jgi:hypothetical protein
MKKSLFCLFLITALAALQAQNAPNNGQTAYYKQTGIVRNNVKTAGDNTGQFITFTRMGCYDSNNQGYEVGNGFLAYQKLENNIHAYYGKSYWGEKTSYFFSADFGKINIQTQDGIIYVYEKTTAPAGITTCAKIYQPPPPPERQEERVGIIDNSQTTVINNNPSTDTWNNQQQAVQPVYGNCPSCQGKGNRVEYLNATSGATRSVWCAECRQSLSPHTHRRCDRCRGTGQIRIN